MRGAEGRLREIGRVRESSHPQNYTKAVHVRLLIVWLASHHLERREREMRERRGREREEGERVCLSNYIPYINWPPSITLSLTCDRFFFFPIKVRTHSSPPSYLSLSFKFPFLLFLPHLSLSLQLPRPQEQSKQEYPRWRTSLRKTL